MVSALDELLKVASPAIGPETDCADEIPEALRPVLVRRNGFYAFESSLHFYPCGASSSEVVTLQVWNRDDLWRSNYQGLADHLYFFAEDVFGGQFALAHDGIVSFEPETGETQLIATDIDSWASKIMSNYSVLTGWPLASDWQRVNGALPHGKRLMPKRPFVLGGEYSLSNVYALDAVTSMRLRGDIAIQIREHPDGTVVSYTVVE
jgi:hypothetical protein